jgi:hypothetical protein
VRTNAEKIGTDSEFGDLAVGLNVIRVRDEPV